MNKDARIFVAGHSGLVGSAIVRRLETEGFSNLLLRRSAQLDLRTAAAVDDFFKSEAPQYVFLAAARVGGILANDSYPANFIRDNLQIQTNVIDAAWRSGVEKLLFLGSSCIYPKMAAQPLKEDYLLTGPLESTNQWYAIAKIAGIKMCQAYCRQYGFNAISVMPTNLYGKGDNFDLESSHVLPALIRKFHLAKLAAAGDVAAMLADEQIYGTIPEELLEMLGIRRNGRDFETSGGKPRVMLWGSGSPMREFLHVDDLALATLFLMDKYDSEEIINVGVGEDLTISALALLVQEIVGFDGEVIWDSSKPDGTPRKLMDVSRITGLGWRAGISLADGIADTYSQYCRQ
jgi:GDP-L-fucose synthase